MSNEKCGLAHVNLEDHIWITFPQRPNKTTVSDIWINLISGHKVTEWTPDDHLRHAAFAGLRQDKNARNVVREEG